MTDDSTKTVILQAEMAALLHDVGKFTRKFIKEAAGGGENLTTIHTTDFLNPKKKMITDSLARILNQSIKGDWLCFPKEAVPLKTLGDLLKFHHAKTYKDEKEILDYYHGQDVQNYLIPLAVKLLMIADTTDSASSKGGAAFKVNKKKEKRETLLSSKKAMQKIESDDPATTSCYLATPFGEKQTAIKLDQFQEASTAFQNQLADLFEGFAAWNPKQLEKKRVEVLTLMEKKLSSALAETRLPNNDVTLWQHSYSTASMFKAMLSWHMLTQDYTVDGSNDLLHHREKLAFLGVQWDEHKLIQRASRPKEILGIKESLIKLRRDIKDQVEIEFYLGNEVYKDSSGIYFLVPSPQKLEAQGINHISLLLDRIESLINNHELFTGVIEYRIVSKDIGIQLLGLGNLLGSESVTGKKDSILRSGPATPSWIGLWDKNSAGNEICSRCTFRPVPTLSVTSGSQADEERICEYCAKLIKNGEKLRTSFEQQGSTLEKDILKGILGLDSGTQFQNFKTDELISDSTENKRLALVQGIFDFRPFMGGDAYASILARRPEDYNKKPKADEKSREINTWEALLSSLETAWVNIKGENRSSPKISKKDLHTLQQLFQDTFLGKRDGRVPGNSEYEKVRNYIEQIVLKSPFPQKLSETVKIALYALRQHPAPSRLTAVWEHTRKICARSVVWCEENRVKYFPVNVEPGKFQILLPAENAWDLIQAMYGEYLDNAKRVRHVLPFHLSSSVFYYKFPLYIAMDAMRRFSQIQVSKNSNPKVWTLETTPEKKDDNYILNWLDDKNRPVQWEIPVHLPNGKKDEFYAWFWVEDKSRPFYIDELQKGHRVNIYPSTFDFEVLDATTRRYDIYLDETTRSRPHFFCSENGPRPYPLSDLKKWQTVMDDPVYKSAVPSQLNRLITLVGGLHQEWKKQDAVLKTQAEDYLTLCLGKQGRNFIDMAVSGAILDLYEWSHLIKKQPSDHPVPDSQ